MSERLTHYPFSTHESESIIRCSIQTQTRELLSNPIFNSIDRTTTHEYIDKYFDTAESLFKEEEEARGKGVSGANLYYHSKEHAVYQTTYDALNISKAILNHKELSKHISKNGIAAIIIGAMFHDAGYVYKAPKNTNYAARTPIHVAQSIVAVSEIIDQTGLPKKFDTTVVKNLAKIGILNTQFPHTNEVKMVIDMLTKRLVPKERKEAHIVRLAIQLADLGGQTARIDRNNLLKDLRQEINEATPGAGTRIIGNNQEIEEKGKQFINNVVKPSVGKTANAFFKSHANPFSIAWEK